MLLTLAFIAFIWCFCSVLCGIIAENKARSVLGWAMLGLIFGPFAAIMLLALKAKRGDGFWS